MDRKYWEKIAPNYDDEIFDVLRNDKLGKIIKAIKKTASKKKSVIDIGCAVGKWIPVLSAMFKEVVAADISATNLQIAQQRHTHFTNVEYMHMDMSADDIMVQPCDVAVCINAILTDSLLKRINFFQSLHISLNKKGTLILVVPSLESKLYTNIIANQWNVDENNDEKIPSSKKAFELANNIKQGVTDIDNVPTKHYLREELELLLKNEGFTVKQIEKINYTWETEFKTPPKWLKSPYPWDWMIVAKKNT
jgi:2-polyprenyl-3-methyl-5-hydroxy-6-metoxy-1,4-benzoquinol methylase